MEVASLQLLVSGLLLGGIYGLAAFGLSVSFGVLNVLNLAHGEFLVAGALLGTWLFEVAGVNPFASAALAVPLFALLGAGFYALLLRALERKPPQQHLVGSILVSLGASLVIEDLLVYFWDRPITGIPYQTPVWEVGGVVVSSLRLLILAFIALLAVVLQLWLRWTYSGRSVRAILQCREGARLIGVPLSRTCAAVFGLGVALAASAGVLYATLFAVTPSLGTPLTIKYLAVVVLGGLGSLVGAALGGLLLGLAESFTTYFIGAQWAPAIAFLLLVCVLLVRPRGLLGRAR